MQREPLNCRLTMWDAPLDQPDAIERHLSISLWIGNDFDHRKAILASLRVGADQPAAVRDVVSDGVGMPGDLFDDAILGLYQEAIDTAGWPTHIKLCSVDFEPALESVRTHQRLMSLLQHGDQVTGEVQQ